MSFLLLFIIIIHLGCSYIKKNNTNFELNIFFLAIFVFIGLRAPETGTDTYGYVVNFMRRGSLNLSDIIKMYSEDNEIGYLIFTKALYILAPFKQSLLIVQGGIVALAYRYFIKKCCKTNYFFSVLIFMAFGLLNFHMTGIRQSIAMSICMFAYVFIIEKKYFRAVLAIALAATFHLSAIVFTTAFIFGVVWKRNNNLVSTILLCLVMSLSVGTLLSLVSQLREKWNMYATIEGTSNGFIFFVILLIVVVLSEYVKKSIHADEQVHMRVNYVSLILWSGRLIGRTFERPTLFFIPACMVTLPDVFEHLTNNKYKLLFYLLTIILICSFYMYRYSGIQYIFAI